MTSSYSKTSVFLRPHVNEKLAFSNISTPKSNFEKKGRGWGAFSVTVFTGYVWTEGQTEEKISAFSKQNGYAWTGP